MISIYQLSTLSINNAENSIKTHIQTLFSVKRICAIPSFPPTKKVIERCHQGKTWAPVEDATAKFSFITSMFEGYTSELLLHRPERFVITGPVLIATAIGIGAASVATAGVTATYVAKEETNRIALEVKIHREEDLDNGIHNNMLNFNISVAIAKDLDNIRYASTLSALNVNELYQATSSNNEVKHLFSKASVFSFSDPSTEQWFTNIADMVSNNTGHLSKSESEEVTRLSAELSNMVTMLVPLSNVSHKCEDKLLLKTMISPHIDYRARMEVEMVDGRLQYKYKNDSTYILISQDAVLSQSNKMFNQDIHVIGRTCTIHKSINSTSSSTGNALFENFHSFMNSQKWPS